MKHFSIQLLSLFVWLLSQLALCANQSFIVLMTQQQYNIHFDVYISQPMKKRCFVKEGKNPDSCIDYCQLVYQYAPQAPYKNAQFYNYRTRKCQSRPICTQKGAKLSEDGIYCFDTVTNLALIGANAVQSNKTKQNVTVLCVNGKIELNQFKMKDCKCNQFWGSMPYPVKTTTGKQLIKCNERLPIWSYFPNYAKFYYDKYYDNMFPYTKNPDYWYQAFLYYIRDAKYRVIQFFVPVQLQMVAIMFPTQSTFKPIDWVWFFWLLIIFAIIFTISLYEHCIRKSRSHLPI